MTLFYNAQSGVIQKRNADQKNLDAALKLALSTKPLLYAEDDPITSDALSGLLGAYFKDAVLAKNGKAMQKRRLEDKNILSCIEKPFLSQAYLTMMERYVG